MECGKRKKYLLFFVLAEVIVISGLVIILLNRSNEDINTSITDWESNYIDYDNGWYVDENIIKTSTPVDIIYGPYIDLKKGTYSVTIEYECDYDQNCLVYTMPGNKERVKAEPKKLRWSQNRISYDFALTGKVDDMEVVVQYNGQGALQIKNIEIELNTISLKKSLIIVLFFFVMIDLCVYFYTKQKWPQVVMALEVGAMIFLLAAIVIQHKENNVAADITITDWKSQYIKYNDGWYIDESIVKSDVKIENDMKEDEGALNLIYGPYATLKRGSYSVKVEYECDENQSCFAPFPSSPYLKTGKANILSKNQTSVSFDFTLTEDIDNFELNVQYNGTGKLRVKNIEIYPSAAGLQRMLAIVILFSLCIDVYLYFRKYIESNRMLIFEICGIILLVSCPLFVSGINAGHDIIFHLMRIEGLAEEVRKGVFPVKLSSMWMDGYGYPVSVFYGDILLYIPAVLRIIGFSVITTYKSYVLLINAGTVVISYICFKKIFKSDKAAILTSFAYATAGYRIVCIYVRAAVGEYSAMMFLPLIALAVYRFYTLNSGNWKSYKRYALILALGMTGVIGSHILSTEMVAVTLAMLCVVLWKSTFKKHVLFSYALAVIEVTVLNLYFIIPFLDYYKYVDMSLDYTKSIQEYGAYIGQYFAFFQTMFGLDPIDLASRMNLTPGLALMAVLVLAAVIWIKGKATKEIKILLFLSAFTLFVASNLFPWNHLGLHYRWGNLLSQIQFPWRYIGIAVIFLTLLLGSICRLVEKEEKHRKGFYALLMSACMVTISFYISDYSNGAWMLYYYDTAELDTYAYIGGEYLRKDTETEYFSGEIVYKNMQEVSLLSRNGTNMQLYCEASDIDGIVEVPMLNYKGYWVMDEYGNKYKITDGKNNVICFSVPAGFSGRITVDFAEPWLWRVGEIVSLFALILVCVNVKSILGLYKF